METGRDAASGALRRAASRFVIVAFDEGSMTARVRWAAETPGSVAAAAFGDADRLPSGNVLGPAWPSVVQVRFKHG